MSQTIDTKKLKDAAEHLEWVLKQYPDVEDVRDLLQSLRPLIENAKAGKISEPMDGIRVPGAYNHGDGRYVPYKEPSVGDAFSRFVIELEGGQTEKDKELLARIEAMRQAIAKENDRGRA
ncbi:hypothetical protein ATSB10_02530 [Dyella thiooxydans]|uniref:Uncharacterized protein n=1 Tax=Dyella thiooxydans TaxID=445710 RepID=A0A160MY14_9GAMM|nr:hypothetical protein [Dyella thiooxydans]AND67707.1 hypothetical protein ATSB10_02530 [Dyella thiooxydans]